LQLDNRSTKTQGRCGTLIGSHTHTLPVKRNHRRAAPMTEIAYGIGFGDAAITRIWVLVLLKMEKTDFASQF